MSKQVMKCYLSFNFHFHSVVRDTIFYYPCFMLICMHCLLLASSRQWSGGYNYSHTYNYTYSYSGDDTLCLFATLAQSAVFICVYVYICESPADLPTSDRATEWGLKMVQFKIKFNENIYKADGNWGNFLTLSQSEAYLTMGQLLESHSEWVSAGRAEA